LKSNFTTISQEWSPYWGNVSRATFGLLPWRPRSQHDLASKSFLSQNFVIWSQILQLLLTNYFSVSNTYSGSITRFRPALVIHWYNSLAFLYINSAVISLYSQRDDNYCCHYFSNIGHSRYIITWTLFTRSIVIICPENVLTNTCFLSTTTLATSNIRDNFLATLQPKEQSLGIKWEKHLK